MDCGPCRLLRPWDHPGKNTGMGCHALLQGTSKPRGRAHISCVSCIGRRVLYNQRRLGSPTGSVFGLKCSDLGCLSLLILFIYLYVVCGKLIVPPRSPACKVVNLCPEVLRPGNSHCSSAFHPFLFISFLSLNSPHQSILHSKGLKKLKHLRMNAFHCLRCVS